MGWIYRGDAGDHGGHVFLLERRHGFRIAHAHGVDHDGVQWQRYQALRALLRRDPAARYAYERAKLGLVAEHGEVDSHRAYTSGKSDIVRDLLRGSCGTLG